MIYYIDKKIFPPFMFLEAWFHSYSLHFIILLFSNFIFRGDNNFELNFKIQMDMYEKDKNLMYYEFIFV